MISSKDCLCKALLSYLLVPRRDQKPQEASGRSAILIPFGKLRPKATLENAFPGFLAPRFQRTRRMLLWRDTMPVMISKVKRSQVHPQCGKHKTNLQNRQSWGEEWSHWLQRWPGDWVSHGYCLLEPEWRDAWRPVTTSDSMPFWPVILYVTKNHTENITQRRRRWTLIKMPVCIEHVCCCLAHFLILLFEIVHDPLTWRMKAAFL